METKELEIPYGYCHCGCGQKTTLAIKNNKRKGWIKGQPYNFLPYHRAKLLDEFCKNGHKLTIENRTKDGCQCLICKKEKNEKWRKNNKDHIIKYKIDNKERDLSKQRESYRENIEERREKAKINSKRYRLDHYEKIQQYNLKYCKIYYLKVKNTDDYKRYKRLYAKKQSDTLSAYYVKASLRVKENVPEAVINLAREIILAKRQLKELNQ